MTKRSLPLITLLIVGAFILAACSRDDSMDGMDSPSAGEAAASDFNDADVTFASDMIPHHRQAVEMSGLAASRAKSPEVKDLASQIMNAQDPEIQTMSGWLTSWGKPVPEEMSSMDMSSSMPGMMSSEDMNSLMNASGAEFDRMFLTMMTEHHQGAIEMAQTEQTDGMYADAIALAKQIEAAQTDEIATMRGLLG